MQLEHLNEGTEVDHYALGVLAALRKLDGRVGLKYLLRLEDSSGWQWLSIIVAIVLNVVYSGLVGSYL